MIPRLCFYFLANDSFLVETFLHNWNCSTATLFGCLINYKVISGCIQLGEGSYYFCENCLHMVPYGCHMNLSMEPTWGQSNRGGGA